MSDSPGNLLPGLEIRTTPLWPPLLHVSVPDGSQKWYLASVAQLLQESCCYLCLTGEEAEALTMTQERPDCQREVTGLEFVTRPVVLTAALVSIEKMCLSPAPCRLLLWVDHLHFSNLNGTVHDLGGSGGYLLWGLYAPH